MSVRLGSGAKAALRRAAKQRVSVLAVRRGAAPTVLARAKLSLR